MAKKTKSKKSKVPELRVYYDGLHRPKMDDAIEKVVEHFGFHFWSSGYDMCNNIRDLAFDYIPKTKRSK